MGRVKDRTQILAKNESYRSHILAMHASKMWALTLNYEWMNVKR